MNDSTGPDHQSIAAWFTAWGDMVAGCDFDAARELFRPDAIAFGTYMDEVEGADAIEARQWRAIWPTIDGFRFLTDTLRVFVSGDRLTATAMLMWSSTGFHADGTTFDRPGRTTAVLVRQSLEGPWRCLHTHFSEFPREQQRSFGKPDRPG